MALTPEQIDGLRARMEDIAQPIIDWLLADMAERVAEAGKMTSTAAYEAYRAQALGASRRELKKFLKQQLSLSNREVRRLLRAAAKFSSEDDYDRVGVWATEAQKESLEQMTQAAIQLATKDFTNLTQTMGMVDCITGRPLPLQDAYRQAMDFAFEQIFTGAADYETAIRQATRKLASRGVVAIDYASGVSTELGAAVRRNMMGGMGLLVEQITQANHDALGCDGWEISAHAASAPDHEPYQGRQYSDADYTRLNESLKRRIGTLMLCIKDWNGDRTPVAGVAGGEMAKHAVCRDAMERRTVRCRCRRCAEKGGEDDDTATAANRDMAGKISAGIGC